MVVGACALAGGTDNDWRRIGTEVFHTLAGNYRALLDPGQMQSSIFIDGHLRFGIGGAREALSEGLGRVGELLKEL